ncbi:hypothetical protein J6590_045270 [Homalodisca vitripennis]|nr:hypothetical protein J6590_045270 [Homalodisca vitripennis]
MGKSIRMYGVTLLQGETRHDVFYGSRGVTGKSARVKLAISHTREQIVIDLEPFQDARRGVASPPFLPSTPNARNS